MKEIIIRRKIQCGFIDYKFNSINRILLIKFLNSMDRLKRFYLNEDQENFFYPRSDVSAYFRLHTHTLKHDRGNAAAFKLQACMLIKGWF
jgi:hypothetical protein